MGCHHLSVLTLGLLFAVTLAQDFEPVPLKFTIDHAIERPKSIVDFNSDLEADSAGHAYNARQYSSAEQSDEQPQQQYAQQQYPQRRQQQQQQQYAAPKADRKKQYIKEEEELEEEEPDRLTTLLPKSTFKCDDRTTGYYADESLGCEVFHYCQGSQKHSWVCPDGFTFHQVHLICMPPSTENICEQSSKYHIVNDYLYKPINMEEFETKPNITLRYSERYFPDSVFYDDRQHYEDEDNNNNNRYHQRQSQVVRKQPVHQSYPSSTPLPYQRASPSPQYNQPNSVYRTPEEINIPLSQRRPGPFGPTTPRFSNEDDDEYSSYEKK